MQKILLTVFSVLISVITSNGQQPCKARMEFSSNSNNPIAVYNLMNDYEGYDNRQFVGTIVHIKYDEEDRGTEIEGFALQLNNGVRAYVDITHDGCAYSMFPMEIRWLPYLIRKGNRVRVDAEISGSGEFINARNIVLLSNPNKTKRRRKK